jgi:hypothetical protein
MLITKKSPTDTGVPKMVKMFTMWLILSAAVGFGIMAVRQMSGKEQWQLTKLVVYATMCSLAAVVLLAGFVVVF